MKGISKRISIIFLTVVVAFTFMPFFGSVTGWYSNTQVAYAEDDTRIPITEIVATTNVEPPVYGAEIKAPSFTVEKGSPAYFQNPGWYKKNDEGDWKSVTGGVFTGGTYMISAMLRIDSGGSEYIIGWPITVLVDGQEWTTGWSGPDVYPTFSRLGIGSPEFIVEEPPNAPLVFSYSSSFIIPIHYVGEPIDTYSVANAAYGGKTPYTFSKTSGPDWIEVTSDGTVSGTPTTYGPNEELIIRVTDSAGDYKEITVSVGKTRMRREDRTAITEVEAVSNTNTPKYGDKVIVPEITVENGAPVIFRNIGWYKKSSDDWVTFTGETFTVGAYQMSAMLRVENGEEYILGWPISVKVDGSEWSTGWSEPEIHDTFSRLGMGSPEFIVQGPIDKATVTIDSQTYTGNAQKPTLNVTMDGVALVQDTDYKVTYKNNTNAGTATATVTGMGYYIGEVTKTFTIKPRSIKDATGTLSASSYTYNGSVRKPTVTVKDKIDGTTKKLVVGTDYTVTIKNSSGKTVSSPKSVGQYTVQIKGKGNYTGTATKTFKINPKGTTLGTLKAASKAVTVNWKTQTAKMSTKRITGYQVMLATNSKFTKDKKTVTISGYSKASKKVTGLKGGKKYYVKIRTYTTISGTKYYSPWSKSKTVTTKK